MDRLSGWALIGRLLHDGRVVSGHKWWVVLETTDSPLLERVVRYHFYVRLRLYKVTTLIFAVNCLNVEFVDRSLMWQIKVYRFEDVESLSRPPSSSILFLFFLVLLAILRVRVVHADAWVFSLLVGGVHLLILRISRCHCYALPRHLINGPLVNGIGFLRGYCYLHIKLILDVVYLVADYEIAQTFLEHGLFEILFADHDLRRDKFGQRRVHQKLESPIFPVLGDLSFARGHTHLKKFNLFMIYFRSF